MSSPKKREIPAIISTDKAPIFGIAIARLIARDNCAYDLMQRRGNLK